LLRRDLPAEPAWLNQVHGVTVLNAADVGLKPPNGDATFTRQRKVVCVVMTADCLPLLLSNRQGTVVAAAHAGWRGLRAGVIEAAVTACNERAETLMAWLGPAIGPQAFEVSESVRAAFVDLSPAATTAFIKIGHGKYQADIRTLARQRLNAAGVEQIYSSDECTVIDRERFFSYRRDGQTGRIASLIWLE
jgi:polyphenol oxidase